MDKKVLCKLMSKGYGIPNLWMQAKRNWLGHIILHNRNKVKNPTMSWHYSVGSLSKGVKNWCTEILEWKAMMTQ